MKPYIFVTPRRKRGDKGCGLISWSDIARVEVEQTKRQSIALVKAIMSEAKISVEEIK